MLSSADMYTYKFIGINWDNLEKLPEVMYRFLKERGEK